ncbi:MAG: hypothetical protein Q9160_008276 [Pyrenula sp. 1 TL-2023]
MVLDPITAIGLTCNVAQLVEISWKVCSKSKLIYKDGALPEHRDTQTVTVDLKKIHSKLSDFLDRGKDADNLSEEDQDLLILCQSSDGIADELLKQLGKLQLSGDGKRWKSVRQALKSVWLKSELDQTSSRLQTYRTQLNTRLLVSLTERLDSLQKNGSRRFDDLDQATRDIATALTENRRLFNNNQEIHTEHLTSLIDSQHERTRQLIVKATEALTVQETGTTAYTPETPGSRPKDLLAVTEEHPPLLGAVERQDLQGVRSILRKDPSTIFAFNSRGQSALHLAARKGDSDLVAYLLRNGAKVNPDDDDSKTPLHEAALSGNADVVRLLLNRGADTQARDANGKTPRDVAEDLSAWFMDHGANVEAKNREGHTALYQFSMKGPLKAVEVLLDANARIEAAGPSRQTPLMVACDHGQTEIVRLLLTRGADTNKVNERQETALSVAAGRSHGYIEIGKLLISHHADVNAQDQSKQTALLLCCENRHEEMALMLLNRGADFKINGRSGYAPLHLAAMHGLVLVVQGLLARGDSVDSLNPINNWSALSEACWHGHFEVVKLLLDQKCVTETHSYGPAPEGATPLIWAAKGGWTDIICLLLDQAAANIEGVDYEGRTALYHAVNDNKPSATEALLARKADTEVTCRLRYTPLCRAAQSGCDSIASHLLRARARVNAMNNWYWTPLAEASRHGHLRIAQMLLNYGAQANTADNRRYTPLTRAAQYGHLAIVELLLKEGTSEIHAINQGGWSALHEASAHGFTEIVVLLLAQGARANRHDKAGEYTPLHRACQNGHISIAEALLDSGADIDARTDANWTPLGEASYHNHPELVDLLLRRNANAQLKNHKNESPLDLAFMQKNMRVVRKLLEYSDE